MSAVLLVGLLAASTVGQFDPNRIPGWRNDVVTHIQVSNLRGTFDTNGPNSLGLLSVSPHQGGPVVTVYYQAEDPWTFSPDDGDDVQVWATMSLVADNSGAGMAKGDFDGEGVGDPDWRIRWVNIPAYGGIDVTFLEGTLSELLLQEYFDTGMLTGSGRIKATGGLFVDLGMWPSGNVYSSISLFEFSIIDPVTGQLLNIDSAEEPPGYDRAGSAA